MRFGLFLILIGAAVLYMGWYENQLASISSATPQTITAADLLANGYGANAHVEVTDCHVLDEYVYEKEGSTGQWRQVWMAAVPAGSGDTALKGKWICLHFNTVFGAMEATAVGNRGHYDGIVVNAVDTPGSGGEAKLKEQYKELSFDGAVLIDVGRTPSQDGPGMMGVGSGLLALGLLIAVVALRRKKPASTEPSVVADTPPVG